MSWILDGIGEDLYDMHSINYLYTLVGTADFVYGLTFYAFIWQSSSRNIRYQ